GSARVAHCASVDCLTGTATLTDLNATQLGVTPQVDTSVAIGVDGLGLISMGGNALTVAHCSNVGCTTSTVSAPCCGNACGFPPDANPVDSITITIGAAGPA